FANESSPDTQRPSPQYVNIRHRVNADGSISNLNDDPQLRQEMSAGGFDALHYIDGAGDGWVRATCAELAGEGIESVSAYVTVGLPDFCPKVRQRDLMQWWKNIVPEPVRAALWVAPPLALSQTRIAANITLPIGFSLEDDTISAIVAEPRD